MGKFNIEKFREKEANQENEKQARIKEALNSRPLLEPLPLPPEPIEDGILLFGKHRGKKISELIASYRDSGYVTGYLANNEDLPKLFRKQINAIVDNSDPFGDYNVPVPVKAKNTVSVKKSGFTIREILGEDKIPW